MVVFKKITEARSLPMQSSLFGSPLNYNPQDSRNVLLLTWLRGFAAFIVVVSHVGNAAWVAYGEESVSYEGNTPFFFRLFGQGNFGVSLFFALSGCTLYLGYYKINTLKEMYSFYLRRLARIYPAFVVAFFAYLLFRLLFQEFYPVPTAERWIEPQFFSEWHWGEVLQHLTLTANFRQEAESNFNNAFWSLPVEFQFYLTFPLLLALHRRCHIVPLVIVGGGCYLLSRLFELENFSTFERLWEFCGGMLCAHLFLSHSYRLNPFVSLLIFIGLYTCVMAINRGFLPEFPGIYLSTYRSMVAILLVAVCVFTPLAQGNNWIARFLSWQGEISYSIYLIHNLLIGAALLLALQLGLVGEKRVGFIVLVTFPITYMLAWLSFNWIEKPGMAFGKSLTQDIKSNGA